MLGRAFLLVLALIVVVGGVHPVTAGADSGSISRDARGPQPTGDHDPLGGPVTPRLYALGQTTIFATGVTLLVVAAALGVYTLLLVRRPQPRP
jgi:hypothetical protein